MTKRKHVKSLVNAIEHQIDHWQGQAELYANGIIAEMPCLSKLIGDRLTSLRGIAPTVACTYDWTLAL